MPKRVLRRDVGDARIARDVYTVGRARRWKTKENRYDRIFVSCRRLAQYAYLRAWNTRARTKGTPVRARVCVWTDTVAHRSRLIGPPHGIRCRHNAPSSMPVRHRSARTAAAIVAITCFVSAEVLSRREPRHVHTRRGAKLKSPIVVGRSGV